MVENRFSQERIFVQKLWSRYEKWSPLVTLNGCKIVLDPKSTFLTNFVKFQIGVKWIFCAKNVKNEGFLKKSQKSSWISIISKIRHYGSKTDVLGDILSPYPFLDQIWTTFRKMDFRFFSDFRIFYAIFLYCSEGPKWANMIFFQMEPRMAIRCPNNVY